MRNARLRRARMLAAVITASAGILTTAAAATAATPIPPGPATTLPSYVGSPATPNPINGVPSTEQSPFMAPNEDSSTHNDVWQSDTYRRPGPLGRNPVMNSNGSFVGDCVSPTFDKGGRIVSICQNPNVPTPALRMFDPVSLDVIASESLPVKPPPVPGIPPLKDTAGGSYFYIDNQNRVVNGAANNHILIYRIEGNSFVLDKDYDVASHLNQQYPATDPPLERIVSALPDENGLIWFITRVDGVVGTLNPATGAVKTLQLGSGFEDSIENSFAIDGDQALVATNRRMLGLRAGADGTPAITWSSTYKNSGLFKPSQFDDGTGTTPTVLPGGYVAITDNADPMNVVVYRTDPDIPAQKRVVCEEPVFGPGASATENSLIGVKDSLIVENNYGYDVFGFQTGAVQSKPGVIRVDIDNDKKGCHKVWTSNEIVPSVISKASIGDGLIHTYTREVDPNGVQAWYWAAIDFRTGATQYKQLAGTGPRWNNHYAAVAIGPDGTEYTSGFPGGLWSIKDGS
jgi:hypothetical protein